MREEVALKINLPESRVQVIIFFASRNCLALALKQKVHGVKLDSF